MTKEAEINEKPKTFYQNFIRSLQMTSMDSSSHCSSRANVMNVNFR